MNQQQLLLWPGQQDEDSPEWTSQQAITPYATDRSGLAELPESIWSHLTANTNLVASSSLDLHARETPIHLPIATDTYAAASWGATQHCQHPVEGMATNQTQLPHFDYPLHQEFSGQTVRADAHAQDMFPRPEQMVDQYAHGSDAVTYNHAAMGIPSLSDYSGHYVSPEDMPSTSYDPGYLQSFVPNTGHQLPGPQANIDSTYFNASPQWPAPMPIASDHYQYNTLGLHQPAMGSIPFRTIPFDAPGLSFNAHDQQLSTEYYGPPFHDGNMPLPFNTLSQQLPTEYHGPSFYRSDTPLPPNLAQSGGVMLPAGPSAMPTPVIFDVGRIMTTSSAVPLLLEGVDPSGYEASSTMLQTTCLDTQPPVPIPDPPQTHVVPVGTRRKRGRTCDTSTDDEPRVAPVTADVPVGTGGRLDNQDFYQNPSAERAKNKARKRTHISVLDKADQACFACWIFKGKCERSDDGPCKRCQGFLRTYAHCTAVPKFTCDVRTRLSDIMIVFPSPAKRIRSMVPKELQDCAFKLFEPLRIMLDFLEPRHARIQWGRLDGYSVLFYGPSICKWRDAILYLKPELELNIDTVECYHHDLLTFFSRALDSVEIYRNRRLAAYSLNFLYEMVCTLKTLHEIDESAANHFLAALKHRILMLYCITFHVDQRHKKRRREEDRVIFQRLVALFPQTKSMLASEFQDSEALMLPSDFQDSEPIIDDITNLLRCQDPSSNRLQQSPEPSTPSFPRLSRYCPRQVQAIFDDSFPLCPQTKGMKRISKVALEDLERSLAGLFSNQDLVPLVLKLSPHVLSIALKALVEGLAKRARIPPHVILTLVIRISKHLCQHFIVHLGRGLSEEQYKTWRSVQIDLYAWVEQSQDAQEILRGVANLVETIVDDVAKGRTPF